MKAKLLELIDFEKVNILLEGFNKTTGFVTAIIDLDGKILSKSGWREMCTQFHRIHPETAKKCAISDTVLGNKKAGDEKYHFYQCLNGLVDVAVPIVINGEHIANLFSGQFFFEEPDRMFFKKQAEQYGFDEIKYLEALAKVPVVSKEKVQAAMDFLLNMTQLISETIFQKLEQTELNKALKESEEEYRNLIELSPVAMTVVHNENTIYFNPAAIHLFGAKTNDELLGKHMFEFIHPDFHELATENVQSLSEKGFVNKQEQKFMKLDGSVLDVETQAKSIRFNDEAATLVLINDITERKKVEKALNESNKMLELVMNCIPQFIFWKDRNSVYWGCNENFAHAAGLNSASEITGKTDYDFSWKKEEADFFVECDRRVMDSGIAEYHIIERQLQADGKQAWLDTNKVPIFDENGQVIGILGTYEDITDRKQAEETLQKSEENLTITLHSIGDGVISTDKAGLIVQMNPVAEKLCGWHLAEAEGKHLNEVFRIIDAETREIVADPVKKVLENGQIVGLANHTVLISKDRTEYQIADSAAPIKNKEGEISGVVLVFSNVTEKYAAEDALRKSQEMMVSSQSVAHICSYSTNLNLNELEKSTWVCSPEFYNIFGIDENYPHTIAGWIGFIHPDHKEEMLAYHEYVVKNKVSFSHEYKIIRINDSAERWLLGTGELVYDEQGLPVRMYGAIQDITERKVVEEDLKNAKDQAQQSDRLKSAFLANMSHEIRTPMNGILGFSELLKMPDLTGEQQQEYLAIIEKSGKRMLNIINDIIDISKIEAGLMKTNIKETNVNEQIEYVYTFFKPEVEAKGLKFTFKNSLPKKEAILKTDREKLYSILTNLVKNAIKYSEKGSIELGYEITYALPAEVALHKTSQLTPSKQIQFYVKDTGIGIPADRQHAIFERFIQADINDKMARQGAGLGLSISKAYVEMLGGKIWVVSNADSYQEERGSTFYFTLPFTTDQHQKTNNANNLPSSERHNPIKALKILIAEDDEVSEMLLSIHLKEFSHELLTAGSGIEAVEICRANPGIDLVLMDIQMPGLNGYEATRQIRQFNKDIVILAQTAFGLSGDREKAIAAGCNDYVSKPIDINLLRKIMQNHF